MSSFWRRFVVAVPLVILWAFLTAPVVAQHSDIHFEGEDGRIVIENGPTFEASFDESVPPYRADDPGFEVEDGGLPANEVVRFQANSIRGIGSGLRNLWYWDGTTTDGAGDPIFGAPPTDHHLNIRDFFETQDMLVDGGGLLDGSNTFVDGFDALTADGDGGIHTHLIWDIVDDSGAAGSIGTPDPGVYAFSLSLYSDDFDLSDPAFIVLGSGVNDATLETGVDFVAANALLAPEPQTIAIWLFLGTLFAFAVWRRQRRSLSTAG